jgi:hypothetical protein
MRLGVINLNSQGKRRLVCGAGLSACAVAPPMEQPRQTPARAHGAIAQTRSETVAELLGGIGILRYQQIPSGSAPAFWTNWNRVPGRIVEKAGTPVDF